MRAGSAVQVYRSLLRLYPRDFRDRYQDDLVQALTDLSAELGPGRAWRRVILDLVVTVPRYRMEKIMKESQSPAALTWAIVIMACAGFLSVFIGLLPGVLLLPLAAVVAITQRSKLAQSMDVVDGGLLRRRRLRIAAVLAGSLPVIYLVSLPILGDEWGADAVVAFGLWTAVLIVAVFYLVTGLLTPQAPAPGHLAESN
jgi:hypothetical protein